MNNSVSIIIPVYNCWALTKQCLQALAACDDAKELEIIIVDNASTDATPQECSCLGDVLFPGRFQYLRQPINRNFAPACNIGAHKASGTYVFFLNNDTLVTPGWLKPLQQEFARDSQQNDGKLGMVAPTLLYPELYGFADRIQHIGITFEPQYYPRHLFEGFPAAHPAVRQKRAYQALTGAALLIPRALFFELGMFDEDFINGGEDVDFGLRMRKAGYTAMHVPESIIYHLASQTAGRHKHEAHNATLLRKKCLPLIVPDLHALAAKAGYSLMLSHALRIYLDLPEKRRQLMQRHTPTQLDDVEAFLLREPLWYEGYRILYRARLDNGDTLGAAQALALSFKLRADADCALHMVQLAEQTGAYAANIQDAVSMLRWLKEKPFSDVYASALSMAELYGRVESDADTAGGTLSALYRLWLSQADTFKNTYYGPDTPYALAIDRWHCSDL